VEIPVMMGRRRNRKSRLRLLSLTDWVNIGVRRQEEGKGVNINFGVMRRKSKTWLRWPKPGARLFWPL
jgi:hypothetical protein